MQSLFTRHSVRQFKNQPIEAERLETLVKAAMAAPTAGNQQEWEFIIVTDRDLLTRLAAASPYAGCTAKAAAAIVILAKTVGSRFPEMWQQDCSAAAENILLEANHLGLGGVWLGIAPFEDRMQRVRDVFHLGDEILPFTIIPLGYPVEPLPPADDRTYDMRKVHYNAF
jgi:nitroreductase